MWHCPIDATTFDLSKPVVWEWLVDGQPFPCKRRFTEDLRYTRSRGIFSRVNGYLEDPSKTADGEKAVYRDIAQAIQDNRQIRIRVIGNYSNMAERKRLLDRGTVL